MAGKPRTVPTLKYLASRKLYYSYWQGKRHYFGKDRVRAEDAYQAFVRQILAGPTTVQTPQERLALEVLDAYRDHQKPHISASQLWRIRRAAELLSEWNPDTPASALDSPALASFQAWLCRSKGYARRYVNHIVGVVKAAWTWGAGPVRLVDAQRATELRLVAQLKKGRGGRETKRKRPIDAESVEKTLTKLSPVVAAMVRVQLLTGMRPGEVCMMRRCDIATTKEEKVFPFDDFGVSAFEIDGKTIWVYCPQTHKNTWRGKARLIPLVPEVQLILAPWLQQIEQYSYLFDPHRATKRSTLCGKTIRCHYDAQSYGRAVKKAAIRAEVEAWTPNQLRHKYATESIGSLGRENTAAMLGHSSTEMTSHYDALSMLILAAKSALLNTRR